MSQGGWFSCACSLFLQSGGLLVCEVSGDRRYSRDMPQRGMEIPCVYTFSGAPDLVHKTMQQLGELKAVIKEISSGILDSLKPQSGHAAVTDLEMIENDTEPAVIDIKTNGSESRPRKVELASAHKKNATTTESILHITMKLVKPPTKQPYRIYIFIS